MLGGVTGLICISTFAGIGLARADAPAPHPGRTVAGEVVSVVGSVFVRSDRKADDTSEDGKSHSIKPGDYIYADDIINTASSGRIKVLLKDKTIVDLGPSALFKVDKFDNKDGSSAREAEVSLAYGTMRAAVTQKITGGGKFKVRTPSATMGVRGTEFVIKSEIRDMKDIGRLLNHSEGALPPSGFSQAATQAQAGGSTEVTVLQGKVEVARKDFDASANAAAGRTPASVNGAAGTAGGGGANSGIVALSAGNQLTSRQSDGGAALEKPATVDSGKLASLSSSVKTVDNTFQKAVTIDPASLASNPPASSSSGSSGNGGDKSRAPASSSGNSGSSSGNASGSATAPAKSDGGGTAVAGAAPPPAGPPPIAPIQNIISDAVNVASTPPAVNVNDVGVPGSVGTNQPFTPPPVNTVGVARSLRVNVTF